MVKFTEAFASVIILIQNSTLYNILIYVFKSINNTFLTFILLNIIDLILNLCSKKKSKLSTKIRMYVMLLVSYLLDKMLNFDVCLTQYMLLSYSYSEIISILDKLSEDEGVHIPLKLKKVIKILKNQTK